MLKLSVCEIYPAVQGEGVNLGLPSIFLRLSGCNLHCSWCDTPYCWNFAGTKFSNEETIEGQKYTRAEEMTEMSIEQVAQTIKEFKTENVVVTGGEPCLQQLALTQLMKLLPKNNFEIETNGTIPLTKTFLFHVKQINCSPKLASSGNPEVLRYRPEVLRQIDRFKNCCFKFVVGNKEDIKEIKKLVTENWLEKKKIYLMPEGYEREKQIENHKLVEQFAFEQGWRVSPRLHILLNGNKRKI